ncbi:glycosyltransferase family 2 protein [Tropicimonas marinistellae]|uniref:glycosyltransferase family 2 protein n=1 Tax=Tropicimonas marinistellae TaxID=1739787 RepID=UPI00082B9A4F|nr:glycosyltransferase family 2 protein [Tropicimonas marinistellae]
MSDVPDPTLSAVVINYNGGERLVACIRSIHDHGVGVEEIILVDNGSQDGSVELALSAYPTTKVVRLNDNPGPSAARNRGLEAAANPLVLLADSDTRLTPGAVAEMLGARAKTGAAVVCPRLIFAPGEDVVQCDGAAPHFIGTLILLNANTAPDTGQPPVPVDGLISTFLLVDRAAALDAGGFNETFFFYFEDLEFGLRMRLRAHDIVSASRAVVVHDRGSGYSGLSFRGSGAYPQRRAYLSMRNRLLTIAICFRWRTMLVIAPALVLYEIATLALALHRGWLPQWAASWRWLLANRGHVAEMRQAVQSRRELPDRAILKGGPLPLTEGLVSNRVLKAMISALSAGLQLYWKVIRVAAG